MSASAERRVLVTGASGFIGRHAVAALTARGFDVVAAARDVSRIPDLPGVRAHAVDLLEPAAAAALVREARPTHLLHLAGYVEHGKFWSAPENLDWLDATLRLLRAFSESGGRRFVGAGTCAEYDWKGPEGPLDEVATPLRPATLYGAAKASAFLTGSAFARGAGVSFAWGRVFHLFGAGEAPARLVPALIRAHLNEAPLDCGPGDRVRDLLPVEAVAGAFVHLCLAEEEGAFNVGSGRQVTYLELSGMISTITGSKGAIHFSALGDAGPRLLVPSVKRLEASGWKAPQDLEKSIAEMVGWWKTPT